ncbi:polysaccharide deacetylase family protein [Marinobacter sediminum]|uniref:polysaccharide deacetylase family protein n=1 Tax=Marinobacter sediminum TaxID=256323 RepID=UPI00193AAD62|nr:polysaccharide deacetylase family protein [Marinobacter sediminum]
MDELFEMLGEGGRIDPKSVIFTIDDGFSDHFEVAARAFDEFGFVLNCFVITGFLDGKLWPWDYQITYAVHHCALNEVALTLPTGEKYQLNMAKDGAIHSIRKLRNKLKSCRQTNIYDWLKFELFTALAVGYPTDVPAEFTAMSWDNARTLQANGHGIYPHTYSHRILSSLPIGEKQVEIEESLKRVQAELGNKPKVFAYPTGRQMDFDQSDIEELAKCGVEMAFTTVTDYVSKGQSLLKLPRFSVPENAEDFRQIMNRFEAFKTFFLNANHKASLSGLMSRDATH